MLCVSLKQVKGSRFASKRKKLVPKLGPYVCCIHNILSRNVTLVITFHLTFHLTLAGISLLYICKQIIQFFPGVTRPCTL
jgi:hypothetical protein